MKHFALALSVALGALVLGAQRVEALTPWQAAALRHAGESSPPASSRLAETTQLYRALRSVSLDENRVLHVREAVLERGELHLYLTDGMIAFTRDVLGSVRNLW